MEKQKLNERKSKTQKGITLVALIITIIVLLILAVVAISSVSESGIIGKAKEAQSGYNQAQVNEQTMIDYYETYIENNLQNGGKGNNANKRYFSGEVEGKDIVWVYNGIDDVIMYMEENETFVSVASYKSLGYCKLNKTAVVKFNDTEELEFDVVFLIELAEDDYDEYDIVINGVHYTSDGALFMSLNMALRDPSNTTISYNESDGKVHVDVDSSITDNSEIDSLWEGDKTQFD